jgi:hypothetical protein
MKRNGTKDFLEWNRLRVPWRESADEELIQDWLAGEL